MSFTSYTTGPRRRPSYRRASAESGGVMSEYGASRRVKTEDRSLKV